MNGDEEFPPEDDEEIPPDDGNGEVSLATTYPALLPPNSTRLERAIAGPTGRLDNDVDGTIIDRLLQAFECPTEYLPWLAWHMSLDLWDWEWGELKRRSVIARAVELNRAKGTATGLRKYVDIMDSKVVEIMVPPQEFYIGPNLSKEAWDAWIHTMPELRIKLIQGEGTASYDSWFIQDSKAALASLIFEPPPVENVHEARLAAIGELAIGQTAPLVQSFHRHMLRYGQTYSSTVITLPKSGELGMLQFGWIGDSFNLDDEGPILYGRRIIERIDGVDYPLQRVVKTEWTDETQTIDVERFSTVGLSTLGFFIDVDFFGESKFLDAAEKKPYLVTLRLDGTYVHQYSDLGLTTTWPSLEPHSPRYERDSDVRDAGLYAYLDDFIMGLASEPDNAIPAFIPHNRAGDMLADRIFFIDPSKPVPHMLGMSFIGKDRIGMPAFRAEVLVDLLLNEPNDMLFITEGFINQSIITDFDETKINRACYAIEASKAVRDKIMASFAPLRPIQPIDLLTPTMKAGDWVANNL